MFAREGQIDNAITAVLDRHDERRHRDVPTITALVGPVVPSLFFFLSLGGNSQLARCERTARKGRSRGCRGSLVG
jgi:hypothetical protein